ncbi:L,D-transpeptidase family protein [Flavobacterium agrisoli]|uniref:L,D-transpeptidase family protein n=1 Tax=Flavobacterium agrisoli TaxID=2793066 RepID=A0A934PPN1_9FLAO|nr:L,D-transpeptidase family protein [Flavobacterium agrisoli]MBK0371109.1 L,D-transpeptidase family protein [Flavobacterium agrisoli]
MKNITLSLSFLALIFIVCSFRSIRAKEHRDKYHAFAIEHFEKTPSDSVFYVNNAAFATFFKKYSKLSKYRGTTETLYKNRNYNTIWYDDRSICELGHLLYSKFTKLPEDQGVKNNLPYKEDIDHVFNETAVEKPTKMESEILLTCMYIFYADKVYKGLDEQKVKDLGWYLPKKEISYEKILDSLLVKPELINDNSTVLFSQYYKLEDILKKYKAIENEHKWTRIDTSAVYKEYKPDDSSATITQIRNRLFVLGDIQNDSKNPVYDRELMDGVMQYKKRHGLKLNYTIAPEHIRLMNTPISQLIETISINMERCRWIPPTLEKDHEYVMINIPSFRLIYVKNGQYALESNVFVGTRMNETVIFSGKIDRIVFSPYWNVPASIVQNDLKFKMSQDPNYLNEQNIEVVNGKYRQKPGPNNSLGLVKFLFPNPNDIYMHDTPAKNLFNFESRTFSHGCINVEKAKELANKVLEDDPKWTSDKINEAMSGKEEVPYALKNKIPIYIGYFTAWADDSGNISFFTDIYSRDERLSKMLHEEQN